MSIYITIIAKCAFTHTLVENMLTNSYMPPKSVSVTSASITKNKSVISDD